MITITTHKGKSEHYQGFTVSGHADGYVDNEEYDLICASVSAITLTVAIGLRDVLHLEGTFDSDYGFMNITLDSEGNNDSDILIKSMIKSLILVAEKYPGHVKLVEVKG